MSAKNSGMNLVVEFAPTYLDRLAANRLAHAYIMPSETAGYRSYCVTKAGASTLRADGALPVLDVPIRLRGEDATGRFFDRDDLAVTFEITAHADDPNIDVRLDYHSVYSDVERLHEALSGAWLEWSVPLSFLSILGASIEPRTAWTTIAGGVLAVGVEATGGESVDAARFRDDFHTNFLGPSDQLSISVERQLMETLLQEVVDDLVRRETVDHERMLDDDYFVRSATFTWGSDHVQIVTEGEYNYPSSFGNWWDCEVTSRGNFFVDDVGETDSRLRARFVANIPADARLIGDDDWADGIFRRNAPPGTYDFTTLDAWSPIARFTLEPEAMEADAQALEALEHSSLDLTLHFEAEVLEVSGASGVVADALELSTEFTRHFRGLAFKPCGNSGPARWDGEYEDEHPEWMLFTVTNTGGVPVSLVASAEPESQFRASCPRTVGVGDSVRVSVEFLTENLADRYDSELSYEEFTGQVTISHSVCGDDAIGVPVTVRVHYEWLPGLRWPFSDAEGHAFCGFADVMFFKRMFDELRSAYEGLPDRPGCEEIYAMRLIDQGDRYEFVARSESDAVLATSREPGLAKSIELAVAPGAILSYEVHLLDNPRQEPRAPFFWTMRSTVREQLDSYQTDQLRDFAAFDRGVSVASAQGLLLLDTVDPHRPLEMAHLKDLGPLRALAACGTLVFAAGENGLSTVDLTDHEQPRLLHMEKGLKNGRFLQRTGRSLWSADERAITRLELSASGGLEPRGSMKLELPAHGLAALPGHAVVLDEKGLTLFSDKRGKLTLIGHYALESALSWTLSGVGNLLSLTSAKQGTRLLRPAKEGILTEVGSYAAPFWRAGLEMDWQRSMAYGTNAKGDRVDIYLLHANRVRDVRGTFAWHPAGKT